MQFTENKHQKELLPYNQGKKKYQNITGQEGVSKLEARDSGERKGNDQGGIRLNDKRSCSFGDK